LVRKRRKHLSCWDESTKTGYYRRVDLLGYTQRFKVKQVFGEKTFKTPRTSSKDYWIKPKQFLLVCENCGQILIPRKGDEFY